MLSFVTVAGCATKPRRAPVHPTLGTEAPPVELSKLVSIQPEVEGKSAFLGVDGRCYVHGKAPSDSPPGKGLPRSYVDCPQVFEDPSWDYCADDGRMYKGTNASGASECYCRHDGNPPAPARLVPCPK